MSRLIDGIEPEIAKKIKESLKDDLKVLDCGGCTECNECQDYIENELQNSMVLVDENESTDDQTLPPIEIYKDNLEDVLEYDSKEFAKGIKESSKIAGYITGLLNAGLSNEQVLTYIMNKDVIANNDKLSERGSDTQLKMAKLQSIIAEKNQI